MNINLTLIAQGIHFFIAYILVRKLLFEPVSKLIENEQAIQKKLHQIRRSIESQVSAAEETKRTLWHKTQSTLAKIIPKRANENEGIHHRKQADAPPRAFVNTDQEISELTKYLSERIRHVK
mgnify:CR=1 FL=1